MSPNKTLNQAGYTQSAFKDLMTSDRISSSDKFIVLRFIGYLTNIHELDYYRLAKELEVANEKNQ